MNIQSIKNIKKKLFFENYKYLNFLIPILIIISSYKIIGYVSLFIFLIPYIFKTKEKILTAIKKADKKQTLVLIYFLFFICSVIYSSYFIKDLRIILYWLPFSFVVIGAYFKNIYDLENNNFYRNNFTNIIYRSSLIYFIFYFIVNIFSYIFFKNPYQIQDYFWMGSAGAFSISSLLLISLYKLWEKINFKLYSQYFFTFLFYIFIAIFNDSRLGLIYTIIFISTILIRYLQSKDFIGLITFSCIVIISYSLFSAINKMTYTLTNNWIIIEKPSTKILYERTIIKDTKNVFMPDDGRKDELIKGYKKFLEYPSINKLLGTGWYSSRITMNANQEEIEKGRLNHENYSTYSMQGIVAIFLDIGLIGFIYSFVLFTYTIFLQFQLKESLINRLFYISMVCMIGFCLFIGYPLVNIAYILFILPSGINYTHNHLHKN